MSSTTFPKPIKINIASGLKGQPLTIYNRTNKDKVHITLPQALNALYDLKNLTNGYTAGDVIEFTVTGEVCGSATLTTAGTAPQTVSVSTSTVNDIGRGI